MEDDGSPTTKKTPHRIRILDSSDDEDNWIPDDNVYQSVCILTFKIIVLTKINQSYCIIDIVLPGDTDPEISPGSSCQLSVHTAWKSLFSSGQDVFANPVVVCLSNADKIQLP